MRKMFLVAALATTALFSCKKEKTDLPIVQPESIFGKLLQSADVAKNAKMTVGELNTYFNSKRISCDVVSAWIANTTVISETDEMQTVRIDIAWQSTNSGPKSIRYKTDVGAYDSYYNVKGTGGTVSFWVTRPKFGLYSYMIAAYTKADLAGDVCALIVD